MKNSNGLDYYPMSVDFFEDDKIALTEAEYGIKGSYIAMRLLSKIYKFEGYYYQWGRDQCLLFVKSLGGDFSARTTNEIVQTLIRRGFFDENIYKTYEILTSRGIQARYLDASRRRLTIPIRKDLLLTDVSQFPNARVYDPEERPPLADPILPGGQTPAPPAPRPEPEEQDGEEKGRKRRTRAQIEEDERLDIIAYFMTVRNYYSPVQQFEYFKNWNNVGGRCWAKMKHDQRMSASKLWKQCGADGKPEARKKFSDESFLPIWAKVYAAVREHRPDLREACIDDRIRFCPGLVRDMYGANREEYNGIFCPKALADYIASEWTTVFGPIFRDMLAGKRLRFAYVDKPKEENEKH